MQTERPEKGSRVPFSPAVRNPIPESRPTTSRRTRKQNKKYRCRPVCCARDLSCASRCALTCRTWDNPCSCLCPSPFYGLPFLQSLRLLPWFVSPNLFNLCAVCASSDSRTLVDGMFQKALNPEPASLLED